MIAAFLCAASDLSNRRSILARNHRKSTIRIRKFIPLLTFHLPLRYLSFFLLDPLTFLHLWFDSQTVSQIPGLAGSGQGPASSCASLFAATTCKGRPWEHVSRTFFLG